jgi:hypothetical protein
MKANTDTISTITHTFTVMVDETKTVEQLTAEGKCNRSNSNVTSKNFPKPLNPKQEDREIVLFHFGKQMTSEQVVAEMDKVGYRPGTVHEILGLGIARPDLKREFPIIALGSTCVLSCHVANLYWSADKRNLNLYLFDDDWGGNCRFAGVRKPR